MMHSMIITDVKDLPKVSLLTVHIKIQLLIDTVEKYWAITVKTYDPKIVRKQKVFFYFVKSVYLFAKQRNSKKNYGIICRFQLCVFTFWISIGGLKGH